MTDQRSHQSPPRSARRLRHQRALVAQEIRRLARGNERRDDAIVDAEARRLARTVSSYGGVLTDRRLLELSGAGHWTGGGFSAALARALEAGLLRDLGLGFYASSPPPASRAPETP